MTTIICAICTQRRPCEARHLCKSCYEKARSLGMLAAFAPRRHDPRAAWRAYYAAHRERLLAASRERYAARRIGG